MSLKKKYISLRLFSPFRKTMNNFPVHSQNFDRVKTQEIELEQCKDVIIKSKKQLSDTKNEVQLLKINKIILENEHYKTINNIKTFLKNSDPVYREQYKTIEQSNNNIYNNVNDELFDQAQNGEDNSKEMNEIDDNNMIIAKKTLLNRRKNKMKIQNFLKLDSLKMHINSLNEELIRKNNLITELQNNKKVRGYKELQKSLIKNCDQINERLQEENIELKSRIESLFHLLKKEQNANRALKEKIRNFNHRFSLFKELSINKVKKLDQELSIAKEKERNLAIKIIGDEDKEKIENHHKNAEYNNMKQKISKYESDMKKNEEMIKKYKNENLNQREEIRKLKKEKTNLENKNKQIMEENEEMKSKIKEMNKKIIELENKIKKGDKIFFTDIEKEIKKSNLNNKKENDDKIEENNFDDNYENE
jgi:hypothetical protein